MVTYIFNGSFEGLLTAIFEFYDRRGKTAELVWNKHYQPAMLGESLEITGDEQKALKENGLL